MKTNTLIMKFENKNNTKLKIKKWNDPNWHNTKDMKWNTKTNILLEHESSQRFPMK